MAQEIDGAAAHGHHQPHAHKADGAADALRELADMETLAANWRARAMQLLG